MNVLRLKLGRGLIDETGNRYGSLTVLARAAGERIAHWRCLCDCGGYAHVRGDSLRSGAVTKCRACVDSARRVDETGNRYGKLVVVSHLGRGHWLCRCDCGQGREARGAELRRGHIKACQPCADAVRHAPRPHMRGRRYGGGPARFGSHCAVCCDLPWRIIGPVCRGCGTRFATEPAFLVRSGMASSAIVRCWE